ncbi:MAG: HDOD domain-containing protein [Sulfuricurvum sp.]|nr:HDOD domain-containing protein [Sulfuricurvum sp.]
MDNVLLYSIESFPPLRESIQKINALFSAQEVDRSALARVIEADPILYTDILRFANAPQHGFRNPIKSIAQAASMFGLHSIRGMALNAAFKAHPFTDVSPYQISTDEWYKTMGLQQRFLELWLNKQHRPLLQSLGGLTFILEIGRLVASYALMFTDNPYRFTKKTPYELALEEKNIIEVSGDELAAKLFELWNFDPLLVDSLRNSLTPANGKEPRICAAIECGRRLFTLGGVEPFETVIPILNEYNFSVEDAKAAYETLLKE